MYGLMGIGLWEMVVGCEGCCQAGSRMTGVRLLRWWQDGSSRSSHKLLWLIWYRYVLFSHETALPTVHLLDPKIQNVQKERYLSEQNTTCKFWG